MRVFEPQTRTSAPQLDGAFVLSSAGLPQMGTSAPPPPLPPSAKGAEDHESGSDSGSERSDRTIPWPSAPPAFPEAEDGSDDDGDDGSGSSSGFESDDPGVEDVDTHPHTPEVGLHITPGLSELGLSAGFRLQRHLPTQCFQASAPGERSKLFSWGNPNRESYSGSDEASAKAAAVAWLTQFVEAQAEFQGASSSSHP